MVCDKPERFYLPSVNVCKAESQPIEKVPLAAEATPSPSPQTASIPPPAPASGGWPCLSPCLLPQLPQEPRLPQLFSHDGQTRARPSASSASWAAGPHHGQPASSPELALTGSLCHSPGSSAMAQTTRDQYIFSVDMNHQPPERHLTGMLLLEP